CHPEDLFFDRLLGLHGGEHAPFDLFLQGHGAPSSRGLTKAPCPKGRTVAASRGRAPTPHDAEWRPLLARAVAEWRAPPSGGLRRVAASAVRPNVEKRQHLRVLRRRSGRAAELLGK